MWHRVKTTLAATVLEGAEMVLADPSQSLPQREKVLGEGGIVQRLAAEKAKDE